MCLQKAVLKDLPTSTSFSPIQSCLSQAPICDFPKYVKVYSPKLQSLYSDLSNSTRPRGPWFHNLYRQCHHQLSHNNPFGEGSHNLPYMTSLLCASSTQPLYQEIISDVLQNPQGLLPSPTALPFQANVMAIFSHKNQVHDLENFLSS